MGFIVLKMAATAIVSFLLMSLVFYWEIQQIVTLYDREALEVFAGRQRANFMYTIYFGDYRKIDGIKEFFQHYAAYLQTLMGRSAALCFMDGKFLCRSFFIFVPSVLRLLKISKSIAAFFLIFGIFTSVTVKKK